MISRVWIAAWLTALAATCFGWAVLMNVAMNGVYTYWQDTVFEALGMGGPVFAGTGIVAGIAYAGTKNPIKALWVWTILILVAFSIMGIGAARMVRGL